MFGIIPAAGSGTRIQPLAFSKELLPVGSRLDGETERPRAVCEYLIDRMIAAGARTLCLVISPGKSDILEYFGGGVGEARLCYVVQPHAAGLCDAIFRALPLVHPDESVVIGLPDTIWFPDDALCALPESALSLLLFPVQRPELFDAVVTDARGRVTDVQVKRERPTSAWVWGALKMPGAVLHELFALWQARSGRDEYIGTLLNAYIDAGGVVLGVRAGRAYVDVGTVHGYREAIRLLSSLPGAPGPSSAGAFAELGRGHGAQ